MTNPDTLEICSGPNPDASIIWLHGLGADGYDFAPIVEQLQLPCAVRFLFPHAPHRPVSINGGYVMRAWYDIRSPDIDRHQDEAGIRNATDMIETLIAQEKARGIRARRILLAGFSQGGAIALHAGLRHPETLGGIIALSTYLPLQDALAKESGTANTHTPILMAHGTWDDIIPLDTGRASAQFLSDHGYPVQWREYPMPHSVCPEEVTDIGAFITRTLG